jgi:Bacterial capsule synthesis protein PGA_cap
MSARDSAVTVFGVGDVFLDVPDGRAALAPLKELFAAADIVFGNCEGVYSDRPAKAPSHKHFSGAPRARGSMLGDAGFDVMTCANNHMLDGGHQGLEDTLELLREQAIQTTGAGADIGQALMPAIAERNGIRVAFLGFCTVYPVGYEARPDRPGLSPLRVRTFYADPDPTFWEPGIEPVIVTQPVPEDLRRYRETIAATRELADVVVVACHWGYSSCVEMLQEYELELARAAVDAGADAVMCCHHHSLRGIELYRDRPIYYGLGTLMHHFVSISVSAAFRAARKARFGDLASMVEGESYPLFPFRAAARKTGVAVLDVHPNGDIDAGFIPAQIMEDGSTQPLRADDQRAVEVADYLRRLSEESGFSTALGLGERDGWMFLEVRSQ